MKARVTLVFATAVLALAVAGGALAAPQQSGIASWSHSPLGVTAWTSYSPTEIKPWSIRLVKPNPSSIRGAAKGW
jgi:hypothetical protein